MTAFFQDLIEQDTGYQPGDLRRALDVPKTVGRPPAAVLLPLPLRGTLTPELRVALRALPRKAAA
jgi:hypothetical protein